MDSAISEKDYQTLVEQFNATENVATLGFCLPQLFECIAKRYPNNVAVISRNKKLDYQTLNALSNRLAHVLVNERGISRGDVVGVALERCINLLVAVLAVLKSGAVYVPIDPAFPPERITHMVNDASPKLIVAGDGTLAALSLWSDLCLSIDEEWGRVEKADSGNLTSSDIRPGDLAYIIYTSGSTGRPKGVEANHGALCNLLLSMKREPGCSPEDRLLAVATVSFDMSILDLLLPLVSGATTVIPQVQELRDPGVLLQLMKRHAVTMIQATPSFWQMLIDGGWEGMPRLAKVLTAGEPVSRRLLDRLLDYADDVWNGYGPTEATVYASVGMVSRYDRDIVIGKPIANFQLYVLHTEDLSPVPLGCLGELYIGGIGVNCGYHNNPGLTKSRFLENNPFHRGRLYQTGDLARFLAPGKLNLVGRTDSQVKVRGYRIELGDVSAAITEYDGVSAAVVVTQDDQLVAYYVRDKKRSDTDDESNCTSSLEPSLRAWLAERRPAYMMPAFFIEMDAFPMTLNGKIDRKALPNPAAAGRTRIVAAKPRTALEHHILAIWSQVLGFDQIDINDNFFQIGGNSLRIPRVKARLDKLLGRPVLTAKLFEHYTIKTLAEYLESSQNIGKVTTNNALPSTYILGQEKQNQCGFPGGIGRNDDISAHGKYDIDEPIALISMACRLPGGVTNPEEYWELLETGKDGITEVPKNRWDADALYDANPDALGKSYCRRGGFINGINSFEASFFGISPREARKLDPTHHIMLETCWEGLERAGYTMQQLRGSQTGVFIGHTNISAHNTGKDLADLDGYAMTGTSGATISGRLSYILGLEGPSLTVDTACSSSLVSTHLACMALRQRECDMAVVGGVTLMLSPGVYVEFSRLRGMSPDGSCRAFAADTQGTGFGEGSTAVVLKRLSDAQRDGDKVHAVLRGSAVNHGGRSAASITTPSGPAQERLVRTALAASGLGPGDIDYIDAHGTATKLGDPIEGTALAEVFRGRSPNQVPLLVGSAKSNLGHTQAAAGLASVLKVVLAMEHNTLPKTLHVNKPTPLVDWENSNIALVLKNKPWLSTERPRRAGVSSFGIGGTNAHIIIEEPPCSSKIIRGSHLPLPLPAPFLLSGHTDKALCMQAQRLYQHIMGTVPDIEHHFFGDVAFSLATTRNHFRRRLVVMASDKESLLEKLASCSIACPSDLLPLTGAVCNNRSNGSYEPRLAMLFTGQGSQLLSMGKGLYNVYPAFRNALEDVAAYFTDLEAPLLDVMWAEPQSEAATLLHRTDFAQPAIFALGVALWRLWQSWGVHPQAVLGHSVGELTAIHVAGVLNLSDACRLVAARGRLMQSIASGRRGGMISVEASSAEIIATISELGLEAKVDIAAHNTLTQTVISGDADAVEDVATHFANQFGRKVKILGMQHAFHSFYMDDMLPAFRAVAETLRFKPPRLAVVSGLTGKLVEAGQVERADYWVEQVRRAVRFSDGIQTLYQQGVNVFLELGPQPVLLGMAAACLASQRGNGELPSFLPSLSTGKKDDVSVVQLTLAELHVRGVLIDWPTYFEPFSCQRVSLPTFTFQRETFNWPNRVPNGSFINSAATNNHRANELHSGRSSELCQFQVNWHKAEETNIRAGSSWGLLCPAGDVSWEPAVKMTLSQAGIQIIQVRNFQDAEQLDGLICLWGGSCDTNAPHQAYNFTAKALTQLQAAATTSFELPLVWITRGAVNIHPHNEAVNGNGAFHNCRPDEPAGSLEIGLSMVPLWGLMRTARNEHPELLLRLIDLDSGEDKATIEGLGQALMISGEPECAVRRGRVFVPRIERATIANASIEQQRPLLQQGGAVLITGGLGGIGRQVAKWLAYRHNVHDLVLTSRSGLKSPNAELLVGELAQLGATATLVSCDVSNYNSMKQVISSFTHERPLRGIVHAAGVVDNGVLLAMTPQRCATTFEPKVDGAWNLHQLTQGMDLDIFMMFSSISGVLGMPGLGNYAAANTFLDALAGLRRTQGLPATSVAYGVWAGDGMATGLTGKTTLNHLAKFGLDPLKSDEGLWLLEQAVRSERALTVAVTLDLERLQMYFQGGGSGEGTIPPLYRMLLKENYRKSNSENNAQKDRRRWNLQRELREADAAQHPTIVLSMVRETVAQALGFASADQIDVDVPLQDIGYDSLTAVMMRNQLAKLTSLKALSASITWNYPNLRALSQFLLSQLQLQAQEGDQALAAAKPTNGATLDTSTCSFQLATDAAVKGCLDPHVMFGNTGKVQCPKSVFLTGATGFLGSFILHELLELGIVAYCLVRAEGIGHGMQRLEASLAGYDLWKPDYVPLLHPVVGDATKPLFGLTEVAFAQLAGRVDAICHSAALVDWMRPLGDYIGPNVISTHEVLRLASYGHGKAVHLISTLATLPMHLGYSVTEHDREYGYSTSKYMAERMVAAARWRGARASIYRVPFITASATTGHFRLDRGDFLHNLIAGSIEMGSFPSLDADLSVVQPVDYLSKTIVAVMVKDQPRIGSDFDFVNKYAVSCNYFFQLMCSGSQDVLPFAQWQQRALAYAATHPASPLARIAAVLDDLADAKAAADMLKGLPTGEHVFGGDDYPAPFVDEQLVRKYRDRIYATYHNI